MPSCSATLNDLKMLSGDVDDTAASVAAAANIINAAAQNAITASGVYQQQLFGSALPQVSNGISQVGIAAAGLEGGHLQSKLLDR